MRESMRQLMRECHYLVDFLYQSGKIAKAPWPQTEAMGLFTFLARCASHYHTSGLYI